MFGPVEVQDIGNSRELRLNGQVQGGSFVTPDAKLFGSAVSGPGCVPTSRYMTGWMFTGQDHPAGTGVMVGLGSGVGPCAILANFPDVDLTVIEIDPVIVKAATDGFPLIQHYQDQGRLRIVVSDALDWLTKAEEPYDFACADGYTGSNTIVADYLPRLIELAKTTYVNCIDVVRGESFTNLVNLMGDFGKPAKEFYCCGGFGNSYFPQNIIVTNVTTVDEQLRDGFVPFESLPTFPSVSRFRSLYSSIVGTREYLDR
jgi:hypothetical protein